MMDESQEVPKTPESRSIKSFDSSDQLINSSPEDEASTTPSSATSQSNNDGNHSDQIDLDNFTPISPKSPLITSSDFMMDITPYNSNDNEIDDIVVYSDSDGASQNSYELRIHRTRTSAESESTRSKSKSRDDKSKTLRGRKSSSPRRGDDDTPSPKPKKRIRRKSNKSEMGSERSHRSSIRHSEHPTGSGYTSMPATGKIFRNLLILEESLRQQFIQQRALRRKYLTFLAIICSLIALISHHLYFVDPSQSSEGTLRVILQFTLLALLVTLMLYRLSGEYQKTIVLPRKFLSSTNKGLRQLNVRLIKIKTPLTDKIVDLIREFVLFIATMCLNSLHKVYPSTKNNKNSKLEVFLVSCQSQCQPRVGVTDVKLVLNARVFNTDVREGWELYRSEFWIHEGVRRRNNMMAFVKEDYDEGALDRGKLLKKDRKERRGRRKSTISNSGKLSEQNLNKLNDNLDSDANTLTPYHSGMNGLKDTLEVTESEN